MHPSEGRPPPAAQDTRVPRGGTRARQAPGMALAGAARERDGEEPLPAPHSLGIARRRRGTPGVSWEGGREGWEKVPIEAEKWPRRFHRKR